MSVQDEATLIIEAFPAMDSEEQGKGGRKVIRKAYRIPLEDEERRVWLLHNGQRFRVSNLSSNGAQVVYPDPADFQEGELLTDLEILVEELHIRARGMVVYTSKCDLDHFVCGVKLYLASDQDRQLMEKLLQEWRHILFDQHNG